MDPNRGGNPRYAVSWHDRCDDESRIAGLSAGGVRHGRSDGQGSRGQGGLWSRQAVWQWGQPLPRARADTAELWVYIYI